MVFKNIVVFILVLLSPLAYAADQNPLRSCEQICATGNVQCIRVPEDKLFKMVFDEDGRSGTVLTYKDIISSDDKAIDRIPFKRPVMFCGSQYPKGMGRVLQ